MNLDRPLLISLVASCLALVAGCNGSPKAEPKIISLDARTLAIHEAALAAAITFDDPDTPFCIAAEIDDESHQITAYSKDVEVRILSAAKQPQEKLLPTTDIRVPTDGEMEKSPSGGRRYVGLTSISTQNRVDAYMIEKIVESSATTVEVHWMSFCGPLSAYGGSMLLEFKDGVWRASHLRRGWVS